MSYKPLGTACEKSTTHPYLIRTFLSTPTSTAFLPGVVSDPLNGTIPTGISESRDVRSLDEPASASQSRIIRRDDRSSGHPQLISTRSGRSNLLSPSRFLDTGAAWTAIDFAAALLSGCSVIHYSSLGGSHIANARWHGDPRAFVSGMLLAFCVAVLSRLSGLHALHHNRTWLHEQRLVLLSTVFSALAVNGAMALWIFPEYRFATLAREIGLTFALMFFTRTLWGLRTALHLKRGTNTRNFIIVGTDPVARDVRDYLTSLRYCGYTFKGFVTIDETVGTAAEEAGIAVAEVLGTIADIMPLSKLVFADEIIYSRRPGTQVLASALADARTAGTTVRLIPSVSETLQNRSDVQYVGDLPTIVLHQRPMRAVSRFMKRMIDVLLAGIGLVVTLPLSFAIVMAIKFDSSGPMFYASKRVGFKGRVFSCYKFRTMTQDAEKRRAELEHLNERSGILFKITKDPRITRVGSFLRKYSLDEVPQLLNVLRGDMSLVGPRPPISSEVAQYEIQHLRRLEVTPGITGLWQTEARRESSVDNYFALDHMYVSNWSLWLDLKILLRTVRVVLMGTGS